MSEAMEKIKERLAEMNEEMTELKKKYMSETQEMFKEIVSALFEANPNLDRIQWEQYTPYFNDGATCFFGVGEITAVPKMPTEELQEKFEELVDLSYSDPWEIGYQLNKNEELSKVMTEDEYGKWNKEVVEPIRCIEDDVYMEMFGDHVRVVVTKDKIETEEYYHD